jgi:heat shock protein HslJ
MKKQLLSLLLIALLSIQCQSKKATDAITIKKDSTKTEKINTKETKTAGNNNINRVWQLVKFENFDEIRLKEIQANMDLTIPKNVSANMGCNSLNFSFKTEKNAKISFSDIQSTKMICVDVTLENAFIKNIASFTSYKIENHKLTLTNDKQQEMVFIAQDWD